MVSNYVSDCLLALIPPPPVFGFWIGIYCSFLVNLKPYMRFLKINMLNLCFVQEKESMSRRAGVLNLLLHSTYNHEIANKENIKPCYISEFTSLLCSFRWIFLFLFLYFLPIISLFVKEVVLFWYRKNCSTDIGLEIPTSALF